MHDSFPMDGRKHKLLKYNCFEERTENANFRHHHSDFAKVSLDGSIIKIKPNSSPKPLYSHPVNIV